MDSNQFQQLMAAVQVLSADVQSMDARIERIECLLNGLFIEVAILRGTKAPTTAVPQSPSPYLPVASPPIPILSLNPAPPLRRPHSRAHPSLPARTLPPRPSPRTATRSSRVENAQLLPFALEAIASESGRTKDAPRAEFCCMCGKPKGLTACFRERHFDWCARHARQVAAGALACGRASECLVLHWEHVPNWNELVAFSKASGDLGKKGVKDLDSILFA